MNPATVEFTTEGVQELHLQNISTILRDDGKNSYFELRM